MPIAGAVRLERGDPEHPGSGYTSRFSHASERAEPGYYAVTLEDYGVRAELTAGARVALHRYGFPAGRAGARADRPAHEPLRLPGQGAVVAPARCAAPTPSAAFARRAAGRRAGSCTSPCASRCRSPGTRWRTPKASSPTRASRPRRRSDPHARAQLEGRQLVGVFDFAAAGQALLVKVAISPVSEESAIANLDAELPGWDFDAVRAGGRARRGAEALGRCSRSRRPRRMRRRLLHRALPRAHGAQPVHGCRRPLPRARQRRCTAPGLHQLFDLSRSGTPTARCIRC